MAIAADLRGHRRPRRKHPDEYGEQTAAYLANLCLPVSFYDEPAGTHFMRSLTPSL